MLCGIFGNVSEPDIKATVSATPALLRDDMDSRRHRP
jgi:hypothetical protein